MIFQTNVSQLDTEVTHLSKLNLFISTGSLKWDLVQSCTPSDTVSARQYLLGLKDIKTKNKTHVVIIFRIQTRENGSLSLNSLVNKVSWQTRFGWVTYIVCYDG